MVYRQPPLIERVLGITDPTNQQLSQAQARNILSGSPTFEPTEPRDLFEVTYDTQSIADMTGTDIQLHDANSLTNWTTYATLLDKYGTKGDGSSTALMIGAISALSARAFDCLAADVYGANTAIVVDPIGGASKARHGHFVYGDGLDLPLQSGSMDFVHTNHLSHMLKNPGKTSHSRMRNLQKLSAEMCRVLAPGGQLFMREIVDKKPYANVNEIIAERRALAGILSRRLKSYGLINITTEAPATPTSLDFLYKPDYQGVDHRPAPPTHGVFALYARKPFQLTYTADIDGTID